jgi:hypothetical protein
MSRLLHLQYKKRLSKFLGSIEIEDFFQLMWAAHIAQSNDPSPALDYLDSSQLPPEAISSIYSSPYRIHDWEIETLSNEVFTTARKPILRKGAKRTLRNNSFYAALECAKTLRSLENAEYRIKKKKEEISVELGRIAARQFGWQTGYANISHIYRNAFIYGQGKCASYFENQYGMTLDKFNLIGFALYVGLKSQPVAHYGVFWKKLEVTEAEYRLALDRLSLSEFKFACLAKIERSKVIHTQDKASLLRKYPCVRFGQSSERIRAPLPELILDRVPSGIFYDLTSSDGATRNEYGRRFEQYCTNYFTATLPGFTWLPERVYRHLGKTRHTPDILMSTGGKIRAVIECKASRMSHTAMFGSNPLEARGYDDLVNGIVQIWLFVAHSRLRSTKYILDGMVTGILLTLDNWLVMSESLKEQVLERARSRCVDKHSEINPEDMISIQFITIRELERALSVADETAFLNVLKKMNEVDYRGWRIDTVMNKLVGSGFTRARYPFRDKLGELLPWWDKLAEASHIEGRKRTE